MTPEQIAADIARGKEIKQTIATLEAELKAIEKRLQEAAEKGEHVPLQDKDREGRQCLLRSPRLVLPVRFTADSIVGSFPVNGPMHLEIAAIVGDKMPHFFKEAHVFNRVPKDGQKFRQAARKHLTAAAFADLIRAATACDKNGIAKSSVQIGWDDAKPPEAVPGL